MEKRWMAALPIMVGVASVTAASAQNGKGQKLIDAVTLCRPIAEAALRLDCYDKAAGALETARQQNSLSVLSREEVVEKRRALFGLLTPTADLFGSGATKMPTIDTLDSTVSRVVTSGHDEFRVSLADGSVWRTQERGRADPAIGDTVHIRRGAMSGYFASFGGNRSVRIERIR